MRSQGLVERREWKLADVGRNRLERTASKKWRGSFRRILSAAVFNLSCFTHGCSTGWVSGVLGDEALAGGAWLAALPCLVALPAAPVFAVLADARGRKAHAFVICCCFIVSWLLAAWCGSRGVWAARVTAGAGGAGALALAPLYCAEIAPRTRGLAAMPALACSCGILFAYACGGLLPARPLALLLLAPPAALLLALLWLPETPAFLISVGRVQDAAKVICWLDGSDFREDMTDVIEQQEVRIRTSDGYGGLRRRDSDALQPMLTRCSGLESNEEKSERGACSQLFLAAAPRRALLSCCALQLAASGSGAGAVASFAAALLRHSARAPLPPLNGTAFNLSVYGGTSPTRGLYSAAGSLLCGAALVLGALAATLAVDRVGRKMLLIWSCSGIACCLALLGAYCDPRLRIFSWYQRPLERKSQNLTLYNATENLWTNETERDGISWTQVGASEREEAIWPPVVLLSATLCLYNVGLGSVPYVLVSEMFDINVRSLASGSLISWMWMTNFLLLRYFGTAAINLGLHTTYYICGSVTCLGALFTWLCIPETRGKTHKQIQEALEGPLIVLRKRRKTREDT